MPASTKSSETSTEPKLALRGVLLSGWAWVAAFSLLGALYVFAVARAEPGPGAVLLVLGAAALGWVSSALLSTLFPDEGELTSGRTRVTGRRRKELEREKHLVLKAIKELEFDRDMGKVGAADFEEISARFRARARRLLRELDDEPDDLRGIIEKELRTRLQARGLGVEQAQGAETTRPEARAGESNAEAARVAPEHKAGDCAACGGGNDADARFCKHCGARIAEGAP